jgi:double zinc ribbon protein
MPAGLFGIDNEGLNLAVNLVVLFLVVVWIALVVWTFLDARRRLEDPVLVASATAASLFPFVGTIVYSILRPPEFIEDRQERALEIRAAELRVRQLEEAACPTCGFPIERSYLRCPNCKARVKDPCDSCGKPIDPRWRICPYCETPVRPPAPPEAPQQRRARGAPKQRAATSSRSTAARKTREGSTSSSRPPARRTTRSSPPPSSRSSTTKSRSARPSGAEAPDGQPKQPAEERTQRASEPAPEP